MGALAVRGNAYYEMDEFELAQRHFRYACVPDEPCKTALLHSNETY